MIRRRQFLGFLAAAPLSAAGVAFYSSTRAGKHASSLTSDQTVLQLDAASSPVLAPRPASAEALSASDRGPFFCYVEVLTADRPSIYGYIAPRGCQPSAEFRRKERIVFRFEVLDIASGKLVTDAEASRVQLKFPFGYEGDADFKQRGEGRVEDAPWTWDFCWDVPPDYPLGTLAYGIAIATKDGRSSVWRPPSLVDPSRGIDTRPQIIEG